MSLLATLFDIIICAVKEQSQMNNVAVQLQGGFSMNNDLIRKRITALRKQKKRTQEEISNLIGISRSTYAHYEVIENQRLPENVTLVRLADYHGVSIDYLLGRTDNPNIALNSNVSVFTHDLELTDEQLLYNFKVDGIDISLDDLKLFVSLIRAQRMNKKSPDL